MTVGKLLRQLRTDKHVSQQILASRIGWSESRISKIECDISDNIGIRTIEKYLMGINITPMNFYNMLYKTSA